NDNSQSASLCWSTTHKLHDIAALPNTRCGESVPGCAHETAILCGKVIAHCGEAVVLSPATHFHAAPFQSENREALSPMNVQITCCPVFSRVVHSAHHFHGVHRSGAIILNGAPF